MKLCRLSYHFSSLIIFLSLPFVTACGVYSFTGASISPETETLTVKKFYNEAGNGPSDLSQRFTEKVKDYFQSNTGLTLVDQGGDLQLEGKITKYSVSPVSPQRNESAATNRLKIAVQTEFTNRNNAEKNFNKTFSFYDDFPQSQNLSEVEDAKIETITDQIVLDMFNAAVSDW